jgi:4-amino-4-deoxy-L-arabinose transferase-like glycosyltransferase
MSVTASARPVTAGALAGGRVRIGARADARVLAGLTVWTVVLAVLTWGTWGDPTMDTGYDLVAAARTAHGQLPYIDYDYWYGPLSPLVLGGIYAITGASLWPAIALGFAVAGAAVVLTYRLARVFVAPLPAGVAAALVAPAAVSSANNSFVLPHATGAPLGMVLALGAILALARWSRGEGGSRRLVLAGALAGLVSLTRPELAVALYAAIAAWLGLRLLRRRTALREAALVLAPAVALPAAVYGAFAVKVGLGRLLWTNLYPREFMREAGSVIYRSHAPLTAGSVAELVARTALYGIGAAALIGVAVFAARSARSRRLVLAGLGIAVAGFLAVLAARPETVRYYLEFAWLWLPGGVALAAVVLAWRARRDGGDDAILLVTLVLALATASTYASFRPFPNALHPDATPYLLPLAATWLAWLHTRALPQRRPGAAAIGTGWLALLAIAAAGLVVHDARAETFTVHGPGGSLTARPADGPALQAAVDAIDRETRPGEQVLIAPQLSSLPILADRPTALRQLSLLPGSFATAADEAEAVRRLASVKLAIVDRTPLTLYEQGPFGTTFDRGLAAALRRDFIDTRPQAEGRPHARTLDVLVRRTS